MILQGNLLENKKSEDSSTLFFLLALLCRLRAF